MEKALLVLALSGLLSTAAAAADANAGGLHAPAPPPRAVGASPPQLLMVPGSTVYYARGAKINLFAHAGRYYSLHNDAWFVAASHNGPWAVVGREQVPDPVLAVPLRYYRVPPGQAKSTPKRTSH